MARFANTALEDGAATSNATNHREDTMAIAHGFVVSPGQGAIWNMSPGRTAAIKMQSRETGESMMMFEEAAPPGTVTPFHLHHESDEATYVLDGEFTFKIGDEITVGGAGTCAFMPRGLAHAWKNTGAQTGRALFIYAPATAGKMFEDLRRAERALFSMDEREIAEVFGRYGWEVVGPPPFYGQDP